LWGAYRDRVDAARRLAEHLSEYRGQDPLILAIPRGGVVVGFELARSLGGELDVVTPRKIGAPGNPELAVGAILHDGTRVLNEDVIAMLGVPESYLLEEGERQRLESLRRYRLYRGDRPEPRIRGRTVIVVDDGVATGATMMLALKWAGDRGADPLICAVPVAPPETIPKLMDEADRVVCPLTPPYFMAIGQFYQEFEQLEDEEVIRLLKTAWGEEEDR